VAHKQLASRVRAVAEERLDSQGLVSAIDLCVGLGWVAPPNVDNWRQGRVASLAARKLDERAVTLAVVASVRHLDTGYDELLMSGVPRADARDSIRDDIDRVLGSWRLEHEPGRVTGDDRADGQRGQAHVADRAQAYRPVRVRSGDQQAGYVRGPVAGRRVRGDQR
jgi:hypothetical protein